MGKKALGEEGEKMWRIACACGVGRLPVLQTEKINATRSPNKEQKSC